MAKLKKKSDKNGKSGKSSKNGKSDKKARKLVALPEKQRALLAALDAHYERPIDHTVADVLQEARELEAALGKYSGVLHKNTQLDKGVSGSLEARRDLLELAELVWVQARQQQSTPEGTKELVSEAEQLKHDAVAALRYFLAEEASVQRRVDAIQIGSGLADLVDDLVKLAALLDEYAARLVKAELPKKAPERARALAEALGTAAAEVAAARTSPDESLAARALRDRAFWYLREVMQAVRAAGRYVFRAEPKRRALFRSTRSRQPHHRAAPPVAPAT